MAEVVIGLPIMHLYILCILALGNANRSAFGAPDSCVRLLPGSLRLRYLRARSSDVNAPLSSIMHSV